MLNQVLSVPRNMSMKYCQGQGLKYLKMSTTHREERRRGRRPRARHGGAKRRSAEGWGLHGEGRRNPSPVKILKFNIANMFIFPRFQDIDSSSIRCFSFIYCLYLFIIDHPVVFRKVNTVKHNTLQQSQLYT